MQTWILVAVGGACGACARHGITRLLTVQAGFASHWGTLVVNALGSLILGALLAKSARWNVSEPVRLLMGTGLCGALTTFSTFSVEVVHLVQRSEHRTAAMVVFSQLVVGLTAAGLGIWIASRA